MPEYASLKVPELKKLLAEKGLPQTGNKADLIARLQQNDKDSAPAEAALAPHGDEEISYSDEDAAAAAAPKPAAEETPAAAPAPAPAAATSSSDAGKPAEAEAEAPKPAEEAAPAPNFAMGLSSSTADDEARKRADRLKRFGMEDEDVRKRAERAKKFGLDQDSIVKGLDAALPERPQKRGRGGDQDGERPGKRQSLDRRGGGRDLARRGGNARPQHLPPRGGGEKKRGSVLDDPSEKAKAEKRAARFASS